MKDSEIYTITREFALPIELEDGFPNPFFVQRGDKIFIEYQTPTVVNLLKELDVDEGIKKNLSTPVPVLIIEASQGIFMVVGAEILNRNEFNSMEDVLKKIISIDNTP